LWKIELKSGDVKMKRLRKDRRAISTILAALLMVVIVVVASVIVYAWSTGLLGGLMGTTPTVKEALSMDSYKWSTDGTTVTLYIRNVGTVDVTIKTYYIEYGGATVATDDFDTPITVQVGQVTDDTEISYADWESPGYSYTIKLVTTTGTQFTFNVKTP